MVLRADLAADLKAWLDDRLEAIRAEARASGGPLPAKLSHDAKLFNVPTGLIRIFDSDLAAAGIPKRDEWGRTVDVHSLRHTFGTHLSKGGVAPAYRTSGDEAQHNRLDDERIHRPALARCGRRNERTAGVAIGRSAPRQTGKSDRNPRHVRLEPPTVSIKTQKPRRKGGFSIGALVPEFRLESRKNRSTPTQQRHLRSEFACTSACTNSRQSQHATVIC